MYKVKLDVKGPFLSYDKGIWGVITSAVYRCDYETILHSFRVRETRTVLEAKI